MADVRSKGAGRGQNRSRERDHGYGAIATVGPPERCVTTDERGRMHGHLANPTKMNTKNTAL